MCAQDSFLDARLPEAADGYRHYGVSLCPESTGSHSGLMQFPSSVWTLVAGDSHLGREAEWKSHTTQGSLTMWGFRVPLSDEPMLGVNPSVKLNNGAHSAVGELQTHCSFPLCPPQQRDQLHGSECPQEALGALCLNPRAL